MKSILFFVLIFASSGSVFASNFFDNLVGCYKTVKWNGQLSDLSNYMNDSEIKISESMLTLNMDGTTMPAYEMTLFQMDQDNTVYYGYAFPYINQGTYKEENGKHIFHFSGRVKYRFQPEHSGNLEHIVEAKKLGNGNIWIRNFIEVQETNEFDVDETYELKPVSCY